MTDHRIRITITPSGVLCSTCDRPVRWVREDDTQDGFDGYWVHDAPDELAAAMRRHPAGKGKETA